MHSSRPKYIQWSEINSVGLEQLDAEHQHLVELINRVFDLVSEASGSDNLPFARRILNDIVEYTNVHFEHEEKVLASVQYPDLKKHQAVHQALRNRMLEMQKLFDRWPTYSGAREVLRFLREWWTSHINRTDAAYAAYASGHLETRAISNVDAGPESAH